MSVPAPTPTVQSVVVRNAHGIHCRPSAVIVRASQDFEDHQICVSAPNGDTDLRSVIGLIGLGIECNSKITISVTGPRQQTVADKLCELFATHFDFPPRDPQDAAVPGLE